MLKQLAYENANEDCKATLNAIHQNGSLADFVRACQNIGIQAHKQTMLAQAICAAFKNNFNSSPAKCFQSEKPGHIKKDCHSHPKTGVIIPPPTGDIKTPGLCPQCQKGNHWSNQCRPKVHKNSSPLQLGNGQRGQHQAPQTTGAYPVRTSSTPFRLSSASQLLPAEVLGWTSQPE